MSFCICNEYLEFPTLINRRRIQMTSRQVSLCFTTYGMLSYASHRCAPATQLAVSMAAHFASRELVCVCACMCGCATICIHMHVCVHGQRDMRFVWCVCVGHPSVTLGCRLTPSQSYSDHLGQQQNKLHALRKALHAFTRTI